MTSDRYRANDSAKDKLASDTVLSIAEEIRELALTEIGESDHPTIANVCYKLLEMATRFELLAFRIRHGIAAISEHDSDIPF